MDIRIDNEFKSLIPPLTAEEYAGLEESIRAEGCRDALITWGGALVDGHNRYEICKKYNVPFKTVNMDFADRNDAIVWIIRNQFNRRNLPLYERARLALRLKPALAAKAKEKQSQAGGDRKSDEYKKTVPQTSAEAIKPESKPKPRDETRDKIATAAGVSHDTIAKVETIEAKATPEVKRQLRSGDITINKAYTDIRRAERETAREETRQENTEKVSKLQSPLDAQGLFQTIVIDPPWDWGDEGDVNQFGRAKPDYATMSISDIERLPIAKIAAENCHLYLWITNRSLPKGFRLLDAWGFRYVTCLTWVKPSFGMGNYFRGSTEQVLFAVKGHQLLKRNDCPTHFMAARGKGHSAKPEEFYKIVESCSYGPYIDVFGRKGRDGWSVWGENT